MEKIKLFYSYSHKDEQYREQLEKHLATLRDDQIIDEWHDRKIDGGEDVDKTIDAQLNNSHIILLLMSPDFIDSPYCKKEVKRAFSLKKKNEYISIIPIILRKCAWKDLTEIVGNPLAFPKDEKPISQWEDKDAVWHSVYEGIKTVVEKIQENITPEINADYKASLLENAIHGDAKLDKLFVYPDISGIKTEKIQSIKRNDINSQELENIEKFDYNYLLIEGEAQSGKTSLCNMLYIHYVENGYYPILINGRDILGNADIKKISNKVYKEQYNNTRDYFFLEKDNRILMIDNVDERKSNHERFPIFISSILENFKYSIIFINELSNLSERITKHNYFSNFHNFSIKQLGHKKRDELIKKCIGHDEQTNFDDDNSEQLARLDRDTHHVDSIIKSNIVPSYPVFIVTIFHILESRIGQDLSETSYGHCYHAMVTINLIRAGIKLTAIDSYFNFLTHLAYFMFSRNNKTIYEENIDKFLRKYKEDFVGDTDTIFNKLIQSGIIAKKNDQYSFQYIYIYYFFVAKYISKNINEKDIKNKIGELLSKLYLKDNANIIIFITHHTDNENLLYNILFSSMDTFDKYKEATLENDEKSIINNIYEALPM